MTRNLPTDQSDDASSQLSVFGFETLPSRVLARLPRVCESPSARETRLGAQTTEWRVDPLQASLAGSEERATEASAVFQPPSIAALSAGDESMADRRWRVDASTETAPSGRNAASYGGTLPLRGAEPWRAPQKETSGFAERLIAGYAVIAPHASVIVTVALIFSAGLLYWLTNSRAPMRRSVNQARQGLEVWHSEAHRIFTRDDSNVPASQTNSSRLNGRMLGGATTTRVIDAPENASFEGPQFEFDKPASGAQSAPSLSPSGPMVSEKRDADAPAAPATPSSDRSPSFGVAENHRSPYPATPFPKIDFVAAGMAVESTTRK